MDVKLVVVIAACLVAGCGSVCGQRWPKPTCCMLSQFTADLAFQETTILADENIGLVDFVGEMAYDAIDKSYAFIGDTYFDNGTETSERYVSLYAKGLAYYIQTTGGEEECYVGELMPPRFPYKCIPGDAEFISDVTFGDSDLLGKSYKTIKEDAAFLYVTRSTVTDDYCVPIVDNIVVEDRSSTPPEIQLMEIEYSGVRLGVCDPEKYFKVPDDCKKEDNIASKGKLRRLAKNIFKSSK